MSVIKKYWKVLLALVLIIASILILMLKFFPAREAFKAEEANLNTTVDQLQLTISENLRYEPVQDLLEPATKALEVSRLALYRRFPADLLEEDQIMYVLYLEEKFGTEINFNFGTKNTLARFSDGSTLNGLTLTVNYEASYDDFKNMIEYLANDSNVTSIQYATMDYDAENDMVTGNLTLMRYMMESGDVYYYTPNITAFDKGKDNIFEGSVLTPEDVKNQTSTSIGGNSTSSSGSGTSSSAGEYPEWLLGPKEDAKK